MTPVSKFSPANAPLHSLRPRFQIPFPALFVNFIPIPRLFAAFLRKRAALENKIGIVQRGQRVGADIANLRRNLRHAFQNILDMLPFQLLKDGADADLRAILPVNPDFALVGTAGLRHYLHATRNLPAAVRVVAHQSGVVNIVPDYSAQALQMFRFLARFRPFGGALFV